MNQNDMTVEQFAMRNLAEKLADAEIRASLAEARAVYLQQELRTAQARLAEYENEEENSDG